MESKAVMGLDEYTSLVRENEGPRMPRHWKAATVPALVAMAIDDLGGGDE